MRSLFLRIKENVRIHGLGFLFVGAINTLFGYFGSVGMYELFKGYIPLAAIIVISRIVTITFSFLTYKIFLFRTKGQWIKEYLRCFISYGFTSACVMCVLYALVEYMEIPFWIAQFVATGIGVVLNFIAHSCFTFSR